MMSNIDFLYEQLRQAIDGGSESMTHDDALDQIAYWRDQCSLIQSQQEPVVDCPRCGHCCPQRKPLTDEEIEQLIPDDDTPMSLGEAFVKFARLVEAHHGIKGEA